MNTDRHFSIFALLLCMTISTILASDVPAEIVASAVSPEEASEAEDYVPNEVLVKFKKGTTEAEKEAVRQSLCSEIIKCIKSIRLEHWKLLEDVSVAEAIEILGATPCVEDAEPNYLYEPYTVPNDPFFQELWFMENTGQSVNGRAGDPGADISATEAWGIETGSHDVVIAVIDSGVAFDHPDIADNVWTNEDDTAKNGVDDDGNGYVDDVYGWDFVNNDNNPSDYSRDLYCNGHGTHVAGTIAAQGNNHIGVAGVMWQASIMPLQIFDIFEESPYNSGRVQLMNIMEALAYAVDNGAKIVNCSFGSGSYSRLLFDAIEYAHDNGVLVVAAAGNEGTDTDTSPQYPSGYDLPNIISVAATDEWDRLTSYSNYGSQSVDVAAPGGGGAAANIYSTIPPARETLFHDDFESGLGKWGTEGIYEVWSVGYDAALGSNAALDSVGLYHAYESSYLETAMSIDARNCRGVHFQWEMRYSLEKNRDFLFWDVSTDENDYLGVGSFTGSSGGAVPFKAWCNDIDLGAFWIAFRLETEQTNYDGVGIDDVKITGIPWEFVGNEYGYKSGTSMAAPVVSGVAGLVWSSKPGLTHLEVKDAILNSVDPVSSLNGKVRSGGRVNACNALPPPAPSGLAAAATSENSIELAWTDNAPNESGFQIERKLESEDNFTKIAMVSSDMTAYSDSGLVKATTYQYRVGAFNAAHGSNYSKEVYATTLGGLPAAPTNVSATDGTLVETIQVTWDAVPDATSYEVYRCLSSDGTKANVGATSSTSYDDTTASVATTYYYWVTASNAYGEGDFSAHDTGWAACEPPDPSATIAYPSSDDDGGFTVEWAAVTDATSYHLQRSTSSSFDDVITVYDGPSTSWDETGLGDGIYYYRVNAASACGISDWRSGGAVVVGSTSVPVISMDGTSISGSCLQGHDASPQTFEIWNSGEGTFEYSITDDGAWLTCTPSEGTASEEHDTITVAYETSGMTPDTYTATITVNAPEAANSPSAMPVSLTVSPNQSPAADAGPDEAVTEGDVVTLDGSSSSDADDGIASCEWIQIGGTAVTLSDPAAVSPTFTAPEVDEETALTFQLTVTDNGGMESTDTCVVTVAPKPSGGGGGGCFISSLANSPEQ
ncbi:MAG: S8 family serine peptidase [Thermodesulfobacteriota bacterium]|nr:S8 family serine peptidase [Thermodesulfobacteriota bacterium]